MAGNMSFTDLVDMSLLPGKIEIAQAEQTAQKAMAKATVRMAVITNAKAKKEAVASGLTDAELKASANELGVTL